MLNMIPIAPRILGLSGLLPAMLLLAASLFGPPEWRWSAVALAYGYGALIFSFLGGLWWGLAAAKPGMPGWIYGAAVLPSLIAWVSYVPWILGWTWPGPSMLLLGVLIALSPLVDRKLDNFDMIPDWWMPLRWILSSGLGFMIFIMGCLASVKL